MLGQTIRNRRIELGISQLSLAVSIGVSQAAISAYERGIRRPRVDRLFRLSSILEIDPLDALIKSGRISSSGKSLLVRSLKRME